MKPNRSILSVPGHKAKMHAKAAESQADVIMLDLEDSVPIDAKATARDQVVASLQNCDWQAKTVSVRINALDTPFGYRDVLTIVEAAGQRVDTVVVPKVNHPGDIHFVDRLLNGIVLNKKFTQQIKIEASIETARGLEQVTTIAGSSSRLKTLVFGVADYAASIGARLASLSGHGENEDAVYPGHRWHYTLSRIVTAAKAHGLLAIDAPYGDFKDTHGLTHAARMACALGCDGKWAIHPNQIAGINEVFSPSAEDIARAETILKANAGAQGNGAIAVNGRMIDQATVRLAQQLYDQAVHLRLVDNSKSKS